MADGRTLTMPSAKPEPASQPIEKMIPLKLKRGYWAAPGTKYRIPKYDADGIMTGEEEGVVEDTDDERKRKEQKLKPGYLLTLPEKLARPLLNQGKAEYAGYGV